jgi:hypothetical protein
VQDSKNEFNRYNDKFNDLSVRINEKCDDRRADKIEDKVFQCAERSRVEKLEDQIKICVTMSEFQKLSNSVDTRVHDIH